MWKLLLCLCAVQWCSILTPSHAHSHPHSFLLSPCDTPLTINFTGVFDAYETACTLFRANSLLQYLNISLEFDDIRHTSSPSDLDIMITSQVSHQHIHIGGWDDDARVGGDIEWPNSWQFSAEAGRYNAEIDVRDYFLDDDGVYEICVENKWLNSGDAIYNAMIEMRGMVTDCSVTSAPSATPEMLASKANTCEGQTGVDVAVDLTFSGRDKKCIDPFIAQGELLAFNVELDFTPKQMYLGVMPVQQTMWPADLECSLIQISSNATAVTVGYDPLDNQFSGDDDGEDNDSGSYFYGFTLNVTGEVSDLMDASLWLSPSSNLTEVMTSDVESCDGSFCSTFTGTTTFESHGSANANDYYPRYLKNMTGVFNVNTQILKNFACDDHFVMLSRKPMGSTFSYGIRADTIIFAWDCNHKYIFAEGEQTIKGEYCGKTGFYDVNVGIDANGNAYFRDNICGEMKVKLTDASGPWYLFIGSDNDDADPTSNDDVNKNELVSDGLNRYRLEWPLEWASDSTGAYSASILPKFHTFDEIGEYQLCFANTWSSFSNANFKGTVRLVGLQRCESLVCTPGDRGYCSDRGVCHDDGSGCTCDYNTTASGTCILPSSSPDYFLNYEHSYLVIGCVGGGLLLLLIGVLVFVFINNKQYEVRSKDVVVEQVDLEHVEFMDMREVAPNMPKKSARDVFATVEIPPCAAAANVSNATTTDIDKEVDTTRFQAYQVHKNSPLSPLKSHNLAPQGRKSPSRDNLKKNSSTNDINLTSVRGFNRQESMPTDRTFPIDDSVEDEDGETSAMINRENEQAKVTEIALVKCEENCEEAEEHDVLLGDNSDDEDRRSGEGDDFPTPSMDLPPPPTIDLPPPPTIELPPPPYTPDE